MKMALLPPRIGNLLLAAFAICIGDLVYVWRTVERELETLEYQHPSGHRLPTHDGAPSSVHDDRQRPLPSNYTVDPEQLLAYQILQKAEVTITAEILSQLPRLSDIEAQYGTTPIIRGLESCPAFRAAVPPKERFASVAGLFNTGTNLLGELMARNCIIDGRDGKGTGMRMQVPWGKHNPPSTHRLRHVAQVGGKGVNQTAVLPLVLTKDPYHWSVSQCRHRYQFHWEHDADHCPNIVSWRNGAPTRVTVKYALETVRYDTFVGQWNEWYREYERQSSEYPLVILRFEDLLFHPEEIVDSLCGCVGGRRRRGNKGKFRYTEESAKHEMSGHKGANGLVSALIRYGDPTLRLEGWTRKDWEYAGENLDEGLMERFGYSRPEWQ